MTYEDPKILALFSRLLEAGKLEHAKFFCEELANKRPEHALTWYLTSIFCLVNKQLNQALHFALKSTKIAPNEPKYICQVAKCYLFQNSLKKALEYAEHARSMKPSSGEDLDTLGNIFSRCQRQELALEMFEEAVSKTKDNPSILYNLATSYRFLGNNKMSERTFSKVIKLKPLDYEAVLARSMLETQTKEQNHILELENNLSQYSMGLDCKIGYHYALAKELEDIKVYKKSFSHLKRGADLKANNMNYNFEAELNNIEKIINVFSNDSSKSISSNRKSDAIQSSRNKTPVFVMGLPRTGTTLVERILSSHSKISTIGESMAFPQELTKELGRYSGSSIAGQIVPPQHCLDIDFELIGNQYLNRVGELSIQHDLFVDKLPLNFLNIGYIASALPNAKMILVRRNPMDSCYSIYKSLFNNGYYFSYDLESIAKYYVAFNKLISFWNARYSGQILIINYEELIGKTTDTIKLLIDYCGIDWENDCLNFHQNKSASITASASQVRKPIYSSSVLNWRNYEEELVQVKDILDMNGIEYE